MFILVSTFLCGGFNIVSAQSHTNFWVKESGACETNGRIKLFTNVVTEDKKQYLNMNMTSPIPLDGDIRAITDIETVISNKTFVPLFTIRERNFCQAANKYVGELWYDIERAAQVPRGICPIAPGRYHVNHMLLDFNKVTLQTFPFGTLRITIKGVHKNQHVELCIRMVVENIIA